MVGNLLYFQSGGPTSVINCTAAGVRDAARGVFAKTYCARNGLDGILREALEDLHAPCFDGIERAPSAALGTCRKSIRDLSKEQRDHLFAVLDRHDITHIIANGGEGTAHVARDLYWEGRNRKKFLHIVLAPKTIDNDLPETHHCPGFGTAATYVAATAAGNYLDAQACGHVKVDVVMGRRVGWLAAAALLSRDAGIPGPHAIFVPEHDASVQDIITAAGKAYRKEGFAHIIISEAYGEKFLGTGPTELSSGFALELLLQGMLEKSVCKDTRVDKYGYAQRCTMLARSERDAHDAYESGKMAVEFTVPQRMPAMVAFREVCGKLVFTPADLWHVAGPYTRPSRLPDAYLGQPGIINDSYLEYVRPLAGRIPKVR